MFGRTTSAALTAAACCVVLLGAWLLAGALQFGAPSSQRSFAAQSIDAGSVQLTLASVSSSSSKSVFHVEIVGSSPLPPGDGPPVILDPTSITIEGVDEIRPILIETEDASQDSVLYSVVAGPPGRSQPLALTIHSVVVRSLSATESIDGPWTFTVPLEQLAEDTVDVVIGLDQSVDVGDVSVRVTELRLSSDEALVYYDVAGASTDASLSNSLKTPVRLVYPDGTVVRGYEVSTNGDAVGEHIAGFPPLPEAVHAAQLRVGPYFSLTTGATIDVTLPSEIILTPGKAYSVESSVVGSGSVPALSAEEVVIQERGFRVHLRSPVSDGFASDPDAEMSVHDDLGNAYSVVSGGTLFEKTEFGDISFSEEIISLDEPLDPDANHLFVDVSGFAILEGPWVFDVEVQ